MVDLLPSVSERVERLNARIIELFQKGLISYDRTRVLTKEHTRIDIPSEGPVTAQIMGLDAVGDLDVKDEKGVARGTCRELSQYVRKLLIEEGLVDSAEVWACATDKEAHYIVVAQIGEQKFLVDLAYSQPILEAVPVDGQIHVNDMYDSQKGKRQRFAGPITYCATQVEENEIIFVINDSTGTKDGQTEFELHRLTPELDKKVAEKWVGATGGGYSTRVEQSNNDPSKYQVNGYPLDAAAAELSANFAAAHGAVKDGLREVVVKYFGEK